MIEASQAHPAAIEARAVTKIYRAGESRVAALDRIDLAVRAGEVVLLMGPSGSGKTTLLSVLGCILRPTSGEVYVEGRLASGLRERELARLRLSHIGFVFQSYNLFPTLRAAENVMVALDLKGVRGDAAARAARDALDMVGLSDKQNVLPEDLSGGQKQRLAIARALALGPRIVLADEPTAALDSVNGRLVISLMRDLAKSQGRAVIIVSHDNRILEFADRIVHIEDGKIAERGAALAGTPLSS
ncbi:MAG: ABC transporter ATP-binding protein [Desulfovibrionaceae bacterium]|nr:ABC transporter ATP-binding protein [Desulfovibrionaceae bacterium]MBF0514987.1 ABC transporter ATP-binding protein [Desulfovibrionaceae bacterium]